MILMNDFKAEPTELREAMLDAARRVLESGWYVLGNEVTSFERQWAATCGAPYAVGVGNGMDAIEIGLRALNIGAGDEVITTTMTAFATVLAILRAGATPVLADIEPETALMSLESAARCITSRTRAVLLVHLYGQVKNMQSWQTFCAEHDIALLEDCAQAHLAETEGKIAGNFGIFGAYSFYPTKNLGAIGDAGALITHDELVAGRASKLRNYGQSQRYHHPELGLNSRLDEMQAAILIERLAWLDRFTERRREIANSYTKGIANPHVHLLSPPTERSNHVYHLFVVTCDERDNFGRHMQNAGISTLAHYPIPVHKQDSCRGIKTDPAGLPHAEAHADDCLSIPCHPQMTDNQVEHVIHAINEFRQ